MINVDVDIKTGKSEICNNAMRYMVTYSNICVCIVHVCTEHIHTFIHGCMHTTYNTTLTTLQLTTQQVNLQHFLNILTPTFVIKLAEFLTNRSVWQFSIHTK